jgi:hypothetical protein
LSPSKANLNLSAKGLIALKRRLTLAFVALAFASLPQTAQTTTMFEVKRSCPIGGESFKGFEIGSSSSWGHRPDGRSYGSLPIYPLPECPSNGFVMFEDKFSSSEIATLAQFVESPEYQRMRITETSYYRAWWLMNKIGRSPFELAEKLLVASWQTDEDEGRKTRYQSEYVSAAQALVRTEYTKEQWFALRLRAANAMRELRRFDEAGEALKALDDEGLLPSEKDQRRGAQFLLVGLQRLVTERNAAAEPANLIPPGEAIERCHVERASLSQSEIDACKGPVQSAITERKRYSKHSESSAAKAARDAAEAAAEAAKRM